jgi:hypothetical protein
VTNSVLRIFKAQGSGLRAQGLRFFT